nr:hypothetical protein [Tanacetum cinerariifolium]
VNHEDAYHSDVDDESNAAAAFMANLSSSSSQINEVRTFNDNIFETVSPSWPSEVPKDEHLDSDDDSVKENKKGQNQIKTRQKREACRSQEKSEAVTMNKARKTKENVKK